jgi:outer membrane protein assembly factor BamB
MNDKSEIFENFRKLIEIGKSVFTELWSFNAGGPVLSLFCADINDDGFDEVIVPSQSGRVFALNKVGNVIWTYDTKGWVRSVFVDDIDNDYHKEIIIGSEDSSVHILRNNGEVFGVFPVNNWVRSVGCADINHDNFKEIILGCEDGHVYALNQSGMTLWDYKAGARVYSIYVFRDNNNEKTKIAVGAQTQRITILDDEGKGKDIFTASASIRCICVDDVDKDSKLEIIAGSEDWYVYVMDLDGKLKWCFKTCDIVRTITVEDIDQDGEKEIIVGGMDDYIYIISQDGILKWKYKAHYRVRSAFTSDLLNGPQKELLVGSEDGPIYVYKLTLYPNLLENLKSLFIQCKSFGLINSLDADSKRLLSDLDILVDDPKNGFIQVKRSQWVHQDEQISDSDLNILIHLREVPLNFLWEYSAEKRITSISSKNAKKGPSIFIGSEDYTVSAIRLNGKRSWNFKARNQVLCIENCSINGDARVIVGFADNNVSILTTDGKIVDQLPQDDRVWSLHFLEYHKTKTLKLLIGSYGRRIDLVDILSHKLEWSFRTGHWVKSVWSYDINNDGVEEILAGAYDKKIYILDQNGELLWHHELPDWPNALTAAELSKNQGVEIFVASENAHLYALTSQGNILWSFLADARMQDVITCDIDNDGIREVIAGSSDGFLYVLDNFGRMKWKYDFGREIRCLDHTSIGKSNYLWVGFNNGEVFGFQFANQQDLAQYIQKIINSFSLKHLEKKMYDLSNPLAVEKNPFLTIELFRRIISNHGLGNCKNSMEAFIDCGEVASICFLAKIIGKIFLNDEKRDESLYFEIVNRIIIVCEIEGKLSLLSSIVDLINNNEDEFAWKLLLLTLQEENIRVIRESLVCIAINTKEHYFEAIEIIKKYLFHKNRWIKDEAIRCLGIIISKHFQYTFSGLESLLKSSEEMIDFELFLTATSGISREITTAYKKILVQTSSSEEIDIALQNLINLVGIITEVNQTDVEDRKGTYILLKKLFLYSKVEELANLANEILFFRTKNKNSNNELVNWFREYDFSKEISRYYGDYFEANEKGYVVEQMTALDSLAGILARADNNISKCPDLLIRKIIKYIFNKWSELITEKQIELNASARLEKFIVSIPSSVAGTTIGCTIQFKNIGLHSAENVSLKIIGKEGVYNVNSHKLDIESIPSDTSYEFTCSLISLVPRIPRLNLVIEFSDGKGIHRIDEFYEVQVEKQVSWTKPLLEYIYDEKGAIIDSEKDTPFVGRDELIKSITNWNTKPTIIYGQKRSGKTSILYRSLLPAMKNKIIPYFFSFQDLRGLSIDELFYQLLFEHRSLGCELSDRGKGLLDFVNSFEKLPKDLLLNSISNNKKTSISAFFRILREINYSLQEHKMIIYCDELEDFIEILENENNLDVVLSLFRATFEHYRNISFIFTASISWTRNIGLNPILFNSFNFIDKKKVGFLTNEESASLINDPFRDQVIYSNSAIKRAIRATGGNPYLLQKLCGKVIRLLNSRHTALVDIDIVSEAVSGITSELDPCLTNYWGLISKNERYLLLLQSMLPKPGQWKMYDFDWVKIDNIVGRINSNFEDLYEDINSLIDMEYLEFTNKGGEDMYRVKIGMLPDWLYNTHHHKF